MPAWFDLDLSWASWAAFRFVFFTLHAIDAVLQIAHAPRYGAGGFNVQQLPGHLLPDPTRAGMTVVYGVLAIAFALIAQGVAVRVLLPIAATLYGYAYFASQLDSYQHHYLMWLVLVLLCFVPTAPTTVGGDGRRWLRSWALRLVLIQLAILYLWAAIAKIDPPWLDGTLLSLQIGKATRMRAVVSALGFGLVAKAVLATELSLAATVWNRRLWWVALPLGLGLHLGIEFIDLDIGLFSYFMMACYLLVVPTGVIALAARGLTRATAPLASIPTAAIAAAAGLGLVASLAYLVRHPLPLVGVVVLGLGFVGGAVAVASGDGARTMARRALAGAIAFALTGAVLATTSVAQDHFRTWGGAARRLGLADERTAYRGLLAVDPSSEYAHYYLGLLDQKAGQYDAAIAHFARAQRREPRRERSYLAEAAAQAAAGRTELAIAALERGLAAIPGQPELARRLAALRGDGGH